ncbi:MAG: Ppx/GppA family phosphatase [Tepidanaerobacteraceae bacterium]
MAVAVIDIGSNSIRLLVAKLSGNSIHTIHKEIITTRLGRGVSINQEFDQPSIELTLSALAHFKYVAEKMKCTTIKAFGTSALRESKNSDIFLKQVKEVGFDVDILSGSEEAFLSFIGAKAGIKVSGWTLVIDIGGGSTELVLGEKHINKSESLPIGAVRWTEKYFKTDSAQDCEIDKAYDEITGLMSSFNNYFRKVVKTGFTAIGVGGTITTLSAMDQELKEYDSNKIHGFHIKKANVDRILSLLLSLTNDEKCKLPGLSPHRADIITAGTLIFQSIMQELGIVEVISSDTDIMEGYILKKLARID